MIHRLVRRSGGCEASYNGSVAILTIGQALPKNSGHYVCKAKNKAGEATSTCHVTVKAIPPAEGMTSDSEAPSDAETATTIKPAFYVPLKNTTAKLGEEVSH